MKTLLAVYEMETRMIVRVEDLRKLVDCGDELCGCSDLPLPVSVSEVADALRNEGWIVVREPDYEAAQVAYLTRGKWWPFPTLVQHIVDAALAESSKGVE